MAMKSKRSHELVAALQYLSSLQQQGISDRTSEERRHGKSQKLARGYKEASCDRKWEEMDHEILICIMKRYRWYEWGDNVDFIICKSWLSAFLDALFPPGDVLDLRPLDHHVNFRNWWHNDKSYQGKIRKFNNYLKLNLNRRSPNHYSKLILSECLLNWETYQRIAQMLPSLKSFVIPGVMRTYREDFSTNRYNHPPPSWKKHYPELCDPNYEGSFVNLGYAMFPYWENLEDAQCPVDMIHYLKQCCKNIRSLTVVEVFYRAPWLPSNRAEVIAGGFPLLDRLSFPTHKLTGTAFCIIADAHKNLSYLDMKHTECGETTDTRHRPVVMYKYSSPKDLPELVARAETILTWDGKICPNCTHIYSRALQISNSQGR